MRKLCKIWLICIVVLFMVVPSLFAVHFRINRTKIRMNIPPGWSDGGTIKVKNKDGEPVDVRVYVSDWVYSDSDGSKHFLPAGSSDKSCIDWIKFYPADFTIPAYGEQEVNFVVGIPKDAVGGYYGVIFFEAQTGVTWDKASGSHINVYHRLGTLFYIEPEGAIKKEARIDNFSIEELAGVIKVGVSFRNTGDVQIVSKGTFDIIDSSGLVLTRGSFGEVYSMPDNEWVLSATSTSSGFSKGTYDVVVTFDLEDAVVVGEWQIVVNDRGEIVETKKIE